MRALKDLDNDIGLAAGRSGIELRTQRRVKTEAELDPETANKDQVNRAIANEQVDARLIGNSIGPD